MKFKQIFDRLYWDYFAPSRLGRLEEIYLYALNCGYKIISIEQFLNIIRLNKIKPTDKYLISRHDVDSDDDCVKLIVDIEKRLKISSSFYFRIKTINLEMMEIVKSAGSEVGYHYEEIATLAKANGWRKEEDIDWQYVRNLFKENCRKFKEVAGVSLMTVCSHGDFANRWLGVPNYKLLTEELKIELGIQAEVYERSIAYHYELSISDEDSEIGFSPISPLVAISNSVNPIHLLTHPRQLRVNWIENTKENLERIFQGYRYTKKTQRNK